MYSVYVWNDANSWWEWKQDFYSWSKAYKFALELNSKGYQTDVFRESYNKLMHE